MTDINDLLSAASSVAAVADTTDRLPSLGWRNGVKQAKTPGFFYIKADALNGEEPGAPWEARNVYDDEDGYTAETLRVACIGYRMQAFFQTKEPGQRFPVKTWLEKWEKGAQFYTEALVLVEGLPGIWSWNMTGLTGKAVTGAGGVFDQHKTWVKTTCKALGVTFSPWAFWMTVAGKMDAKGKPAYENTGHESFVTPPALFLPAGETPRDQAVAAFVGKDEYADLTDQYHQFKDSGWFEQRRGNAPAAEATFTPQPGLVAEPPPGWDDGDDDKLPF